MSTKVRTVATRHAEISVLDSGGSGFPLLLIHGSGSAKEVFARQFESSVARSFRLIAIDLPGHGQSSDAANPAIGYTMHGFAEAITDLITTLGLQQFAVLGWSLGGHIAIELLSFHRGISGIMLVGTPPLAAGPFGMLRGFQTNWDLLLASKEHFSERDVLRFYELCLNGNGDPQLLAAIRRADGRVRPIAVKSMMRGEGADQRRTVEQAAVPVAIVNGTHEPIARLGYLAGLNYTNLWGKRCHVLEGAGHAPFRDQPALFNELLARFIVDSSRYDGQPAALAPHGLSGSLGDYSAASVRSSGASHLSRGNLAARVSSSRRRGA